MLDRYEPTKDGAGRRFQRGSPNIKVSFHKNSDIGRSARKHPPPLTSANLVDGQLWSAWSFERQVNDGHRTTAMFCISVLPKFKNGYIVTAT